MNILITLAPVRRGEEGALDQILSEITCRPATNRFLRFPESRHTHFARLVLLKDPGQGTRLLLVANFDGGLRDYLRELRAAGPGLEEVLGRCGDGDSPTDLLGFVRRYYLQPRGVYVAFPDLTVAGIDNLVGIRDQLECFSDQPDVAAALHGGELERFLDRVELLPHGLPLLERLAADAVQIGATVQNGVHDVLLSGFLRFAEWYAELGNATTFPRFHGSCDGSAGRVRRVEQELDTFGIGAGLVQNQMTTLTEVIPSRLLKLRLALAATTVLGRYGWPPGEFADVGTLHWFAWALVDGGRRLLFISTFDGSWQNYVQDFITKLVWALDALYSNTYGYPAAGMKDVPAFTDFILDHQFPAQVFYSAYPHETVFNLIEARQLAAGLGRRFDRAAVESWASDL